MATVQISPVKLSVNDFQDFSWTSGSLEGFLVPMIQNDQKTCILFYNSGSDSATVTVKAGNGLQAVSDLDPFSIPAGHYSALMLESGPFKFISGQNSGSCLIIPSADTVKCAVVILP